MKLQHSKLIRLAGVALVIGFLYWVATAYIIPIREMEKYSARLLAALEKPREVTLVEFERDTLTPDEMIFKKVIATPDQIASLRSIAGSWFAPLPDYMAFCFYPHHRIEIVREDGTRERLEVCFQCRNFSFDRTDIATLPDVWRTKLLKFFTDAGMPPLDDYSDKTKAHPDFERFERKRIESEAR